MLSTEGAEERTMTWTIQRGPWRVARVVGLAAWIGARLRGGGEINGR
jgi:hypothetical protein